MRIHRQDRLNFYTYSNNFDMFFILDLLNVTGVRETTGGNATATERVDTAGVQKKPGKVCIT